MKQGIEKAAILMMMIRDSNTVKEIFGRLEQNEIYEISLAMANLGNIDSERVEKIIIEFAHELNQSLQIVGNVKTAELFLKKVLNQEDYERVFNKIKHANTSSTWEMIANLDDISVAKFIKYENPQTAALILSKLSGYKSSRILKNLNKDFSIEILRRMMYLNNVKIDTLNRVERVIESEINNLSSQFNKSDSINIIAEIFNNFSKDDEVVFMDALQEKDPEVATKIARAMLTFNDLEFIQDNGIQEIIKKLDNNTLVTALAGASENTRAAFLNTMSQRVARMIADEIEGSIKYSKKDISEAQNKIIKLVRNMIADGSIIINKNIV